ncbi:MAG: orotate phosphoribosyltransferase [Clostridiaceae bacterium]|nr:orotate phosphoribosyltransferase [Clostridiaceae bacterium]
MTSLARRDIALGLLEIGAVFLRPDQPFTWASGIKSPIYCDNRLTLSDPALRTQIEIALSETVRDKHPQADALIGTSTAGIPHAAIAAHILGLPMGYVRSGSKEHGRQNRIEGKLEAGWQVVVVEDLLSTGGSVIDVVKTIREAGAGVLGIVSIFTYGMRICRERLAEAAVINTSLTDFDTVVDMAAGQGLIRQEDIAGLLAFRDKPKDESWMKEVL